MVVGKNLSIYVAAFLLASCGRASPVAESAPARSGELQLIIVDCNTQEKSAIAVCFQAKNLANSAMTVWFSVERLYEGEWTEVATSIFSDDPPKSTRLVDLRPHSVEEFSWSPPTTQFVPLANTEFRIRANLRTPKTTAEPVVTGVFSVPPVAPH
jgi:hypothetical protein